MRRVGPALRLLLILLGIGFLVLHVMSYVSRVYVSSHYQARAWRVTASNGHARFSIFLGHRTALLSPEPGWASYLEDGTRVRIEMTGLHDDDPRLGPKVSTWRPVVTRIARDKLVEYHGSVPLWLLAAICFAWPVSSLLLARRRKGRGFAVEPAGGGRAPMA